MNKKYYSSVSYKYPFDTDKKYFEGIIYENMNSHIVCNYILTDFCTACKNRFICGVINNSKDSNYDQMELCLILKKMKLCLRLNKFYYDKEREKFVLHIFKLTDTNDDGQYESLIDNKPRDHQKFCNELAHAAVEYFEHLKHLNTGDF